jgi:hypothetical protein
VCLPGAKRVSTSGYAMSKGGTIVHMSGDELASVHLSSSSSSLLSTLLSHSQNSDY